jgi:hypothetical protein
MYEREKERERERERRGRAYLIIINFFYDLVSTKGSGIQIRVFSMTEHR